MPYGRLSNACARAAAARCCAGRSGPTTAPCAGCRWRRKPGRHWPLPIVRCRRRLTPHRRRCALPSMRVRRSCVCSSAAVACLRLPPSRLRRGSEVSMRWACVLLPQLALDGVLRRCSDPDAPLALVTGTAQRRVLQTVNPAAHALTRDFTLVEYAPEEIERWQQFLAAWGYRFSSHVSLCYPRTLLLEIESSLALFGPWPRFEARLREELTALGFRHRIVAAPNPLAARILANAHDGLAIANDEVLRAALGRMPVERSGLAREVVTAFARMGLRTLSQVLALPRDTLARRFPVQVQRS